MCEDTGNHSSSTTTIPMPLLIGAKLYLEKADPEETDKIEEAKKEQRKREAQRRGELGLDEKSADKPS